MKKAAAKAAGAPAETAKQKGRNPDTKRARTQPGRRMKMKKPIIGLTPTITEGERPLMETRLHYVRAIEAAGGAPVLLPPLGGESLRAAAAVCDGFLFTGGVDVHPALYGQEVLPACGEISAVRDEMELALMQLSIEDGRPVLGICRGIQLLNIGLGGTLWQDLPSQTGTALCHSQEPPYEKPSHTVRIAPDSPLAALIGKTEIAVNSTHHQAVRTLAPSLRAAAASPDGVIEALWRPESRFFLAVQWHPEYLYPADRGAAALFSALVSACRC